MAQSGSISQDLDAMVSGPTVISICIILAMACPRGGGIKRLFSKGVRLRGQSLRRGWSSCLIRGRQTVSRSVATRGYRLTSSSVGRTAERHFAVVIVYVCRRFSLCGGCPRCVRGQRSDLLRVRRESFLISSAVNGGGLNALGG